MRLFLNSFLRFVGAVWLLSIVWVASYAWIPVWVTPLMVGHATKSALLRGRDFSWQREWVSLDQVSDNLQKAVIAAEDENFYSHNGFDFAAIEKAWRHNRRGRRIRGASTISQQVAKNVFLWPQRSWGRKVLETYFTLLIEAFWSKERILEVYLNIIELGDGVYGAEAAAHEYFGKSAARLNSSEAALLAAVLPNPVRFSVLKPSSYIRFRQSLIQRRMRQVAQFDD